MDSTEKNTSAEGKEKSSNENGIRVVKGWRRGPYNLLQDPLPYRTILPNHTPAQTAVTAPAAAPATTTSPAPRAATPATTATAGGPSTTSVRASLPSNGDSWKVNVGTDAGGSEGGGNGDGGGNGNGSGGNSPDAAEGANSSSSSREGEPRSDPRVFSEEDLLPLPFQPPVVWSYVYDVLCGTWELVLYVVVMLLAIMLETNARYFRSGSNFDQWWVYLYKVVVVCYPAGLMVMQFTMLCEYVLRKYLFFRLLSLGLLVQPGSRPIWRSWYFPVFAGVWVILNVWAWWGLVNWWGRNGKTGPENLSFAVLGVVNIVSFHLFMYYRRLMDEQKRLLKPVQAYLLPDMVLVSEYVVKREAWRVLRSCLFGCCCPGPRAFDVEWVRRQGVRVPRSYGGGVEAAEAAATTLGEKVFEGEESANPKTMAAAPEGDNSGDSSSAVESPGSGGTAAAAAATTAGAGAVAIVAPGQEGGMHRSESQDPSKQSQGAAVGAVVVEAGSGVLAEGGQGAASPAGARSPSPELPLPPAAAAGAGMDADGDTSGPRSRGAATAPAAVAECTEAAAAAATAGVALAATAAAAPGEGEDEEEAAGDGGCPALVAQGATMTRISYRSARSDFTGGSQDAPSRQLSGGLPPPVAQAAAASGPAAPEVPAEAGGPAAGPAAAAGPVAEGDEKAETGKGDDGSEGVAAAALVADGAADGPAADGKPAQRPSRLSAQAAAAGRAVGSGAWRCCSCCFKCGCCCCVYGVKMLDPRLFTSGLFALPAALLGVFSRRNAVWPFRRDLPPLRAILAACLLASLLVGGGIALGGWLVGRQVPICQWGLDSCYDCLIYQEEYVEYDKVCTAGGYTISKTWPDPDYFDPDCPSGRSWFTNGVWSNNGSTVMAQHGDYQNITGPALLNGYLATVMSHYAYSDSFEGLEKGFQGQFTKRFKELFSVYGFTQYDFIFLEETAIQDTQFIVAGTGSDVYMIFRGTDGLVDTLVTDLAGRCVETSEFGAPACLHEGFLAAYRQAQPRVYSGLISVISNLNIIRRQGRGRWRPDPANQPFTLWLTGHSLGGALATLCAADLRNKNLRIDGVYTYGSPRVGDKRFRDLYGSSGLADVTWRYVHKSDAIPQVPPQFMGFRHVVAPTMLLGGHCVVWPGEDVCAATTFLGTCELSAADHSLTGYLANLRACVAASHQLPNCTEAMMPLWQKMANVPPE